ncbi:MAG: GGDEF domain-containing protein [Bacilli bacterium]|nr:GGDEF domain-containing protein [Bacilli bacterium]
MNKKILIIILCVLVVLSGIGVTILLTREDETTSLNMIEKKWIDSNKKELQDISIYTDVPIFSYNSEGIVFDFLESLESNTGLEFNKISYVIGSEIKTDYAFMETPEVTKDDVLMYQDNYALITKDGIVYNSPSDIKNITVGVLENNLDIVNKYLLGSDITYKTFENYSGMLNSIGVDVDAIVVPKIEYLSLVIENDDLTLGYNIDEYKTYYVLHLSNNDNTLNSILTKYYKKWSSDNFDKTFNNYLVSTYFMSSNDGSQSIAKLRSKRYVYGFIDNPPYDILNDGDLVGINNEIISNFAKTSGISVEYEEYSNVDDLVKAFNSNDIDFFFNVGRDFEYKLDAFDTVSTFVEKMVVLTRNSDDLIVNSVNSLANQTVGVLKDSKIAKYLSDYEINIKEYDSLKDLMKDNKIDVKAIDSYNYDYYVNKGIKNYHKSLIVDINDDYTYTFRNISDNKDFANFMSFYLTYASVSSMINRGTSNTLSVNMGFAIFRFVLIIILVLAIIGIIGYLIYLIKSKKISKNNLSKEDKLKYIDMLTSLKNRNYLNDNIEIWDESDIYPQTIIIVDLNNIAYINDNYGHAEGDAVIKEAANVLIKTQNPNSEIIRTNGNEFLIYLVSYDEKQVVSYIKKLNKEFKELAHGFGCAIGYSIINDAIKTIDDAINEATLDMKNNKEELSKD